MAFDSFYLFSGWLIPIGNDNRIDKPVFKGTKINGKTAITDDIKKLNEILEYCKKHKFGYEPEAYSIEVFDEVEHQSILEYLDKLEQDKKKRMLDEK